MTIRVPGKIPGKRKITSSPCKPACNSPCTLNTFHYSAVFFIAILVFSNTFDAEFVYDDNAAIVENGDVLGRSGYVSVLQHDFWGNSLKLEGSHKSWRPLTTLTFRWTHSLAGLNRRAFHSINVLLHACVSVLVMFLTHDLGLSRRVSLTASLLFAVHPIHCEAVAGIVGRADVLSALFTILGVLCHSRTKSIPLTSTLAVCALFSKETGIMMIPLVLAHSILIEGKTNLKRQIPLILMFGLLVWFRLWIIDYKTPSFSASDNPFAHETRWFVRTASLLYLPFFHFKLMVLSDTLCFDWSMEAVPPITTLSDARFLQTAIFYLSLGISTFYLLKRSSSFRLVGYAMNSQITSQESFLPDRLLFSLSLLILPFLPASNLFSYVGFVAAERILYLPSVGYCIILAVLLEQIWERNHLSSSLFFSFLLLLISVHATRTWQRNKDWQSGEKLYRSAVHINPPKAWSNLGRELSVQGRIDEAATAYRNTLHHRPNMADTWYNLGILHKEVKNMSQAIECYRTAIQIRSQFTQAYLNLALALWEDGNLVEAESMFIKCTAVNGNKLKSYRTHKIAQTSCHFNLGRLYATQGKLRKAKEQYEMALSLSDPSYPSLASLLSTSGDVHAKLGDTVTAEQLYLRSLKTSARHLGSHLSLAQLKIAQNATLEASKWIERAQGIAPRSPATLYTLALLNIAQGDFLGAETAFKSSLEMDAGYVPSLHSLGIMMRDQGKLGDAEKYLHRVTLLSPSASSYSNYGAILHLRGNLKGAERWYLAAVQLQPDDVIAKENLAKVQRTMKKRDIS